MPEGSGLLSDARFADRVDAILARSELCVAPEWFAGRRVLDAGCGNGRWLEGFLRLGCDVTAMDVSQAGLEQVRRRYGDRVRTVRSDVLEADRVLAGENFDLVFSWGVLHHTRDVAGGMAALGRLVSGDGLLYLYLYGRQSLARGEAARLGVARAMFSALPLSLRRSVMQRLWGPDKAHAQFDLLSTPLNQRLTLEEAEHDLAAVGFVHVVQTMPHTELF